MMKKFKEKLQQIIAQENAALNQRLIEHKEALAQASTTEVVKAVCANTLPQTKKQLAINLGLSGVITAAGLMLGSSMITTAGTSLISAAAVNIASQDEGEVRELVSRFHKTEGVEESV